MQLNLRTHLNFSELLFNLDTNMPDTVHVDITQWNEVLHPKAVGLTDLCAKCLYSNLGAFTRTKQAVATYFTNICSDICLTPVRIILTSIPCYIPDLIAICSLNHSNLTAYYKYSKTKIQKFQTGNPLYSQVKSHLAAGKWWIGAHEWLIENGKT